MIMNFTKWQFMKTTRRWELINLLSKTFSYTSYLEIGCDLDICFNKVSIHDKIGVDPFRGGTHRITSDEFFNSNTRKFDIIFIDGLHHSHQVIKDLYNSLDALSNTGIVLLHDTMPTYEWSQIIPVAAAREHKDFNGGWLGDCWKAIAEARCDKNINTCTVALETGISFVKKKTNNKLMQSTVLDNLNWEYYIHNKQNLLNIIDTSDIMTWASE